MKSIAKKAMALSLGLMFVAAGCSKDDKTDETTPPAKAIAGTYVGTLSQDGVVIVPSATIVITAKGDDKIALVFDAALPAALFQQFVPDRTDPVSIQAICDEIPVTEVDGQYTFSGSATTSLASISPFLSEIPLTISGNIDKEGKAVITVAISIMGLNLEIVFQGEKQ
ncbi:MAG: calycin-like domain-containing protein [Prevotellaceae bacterium]|jgi:hypothetical protein|nr:calycin-like domain-containing protein [Prevotellaceae bacterium]